jgi:coronin-1B/1C/6
VNCHTSGGGAFLVVPLNKPGKIPDIYPLVRGHSGPVLDTAWSPFDDELIASGGEDSKVQLTRINEDALLAAWQEGVEVQDIKPLPVNLSHGGKKVGNVQWHPTAQGVLATSAADIRLWDVENQTPTIVLQAHPDLVQSFSFNSTGSLLATTCKDKKLRLFDIRASTLPVQTSESHSGVKGSRVVWLGNLDRMVTTGFSRMSDRQVFLWNAGSLDKPIKQMTIDTSSGTLMPFWSDNNVLFLAGKGDGNIRYYEYDHDDLIYLTEHKSSDPQRGMTFLPRRGLNVAECEIARAYKVCGASSIAWCTSQNACTGTQRRR